jgi:hypothetical protein
MLAGVELVLKPRKITVQPNIWEKNLQLSFFALIIASITSYSKDWQVRVLHPRERCIGKQPCRP